MKKNRSNKYIFGNVHFKQRYFKILYVEREK